MRTAVADNRVADSRAADNRAADNRAADNRRSSPGRAVDNRAVDNRQGSPGRVPDNRQSSPSKRGSGTADSLPPASVHKTVLAQEVFKASCYHDLGFVSVALGDCI